ncbi:MAG: hypothetical protein ACREH9_05250 [Pseudomonadota bacterium]
MSLDIAALTGGIADALPSTQEVLQQVALGAASGIVLAGLKQQAESGALDPLGLFHKTTAPADNAPTQIVPVTPAPTTVTLSAWNAMDAATRAQLIAAGHLTITAG